MSAGSTLSMVDSELISVFSWLSRESISVCREGAESLTRG